MVETIKQSMEAAKGPWGAAAAIIIALLGNGTVDRRVDNQQERVIQVQMAEADSATLAKLDYVYSAMHDATIGQRQLQMDMERVKAALGVTTK